MEIEKKIVDGKVAVLISPGFGAGWSTWNSEHSEFMLFDKTLVEMAERNALAGEAEQYLQKKLNEDYVCVLGWPVRVEWLPQGERFYVDEYDGSESIVSADNLVMTA